MFESFLAGLFIADIASKYYFNLTTFPWNSHRNKKPPPTLRVWRKETPMSQWIRYIVSYKIQSFSSTRKIP